MMHYYHNVYIHVVSQCISGQTVKKSLMKEASKYVSN